jgi:hypothetical protein
MIIGILFAAGLVLMGLALLADKFPRSYKIIAFVSIFGRICWIVAGVMTFIMLISYPSSLETISSLENFQERNYDLFTGAVEQFPDAATVMTKEDTSTKKMLSYKYVEDVLSYNESLKWYRMYQDHWFTSPFVGKVSDKLKFIEQ